MQCVRETEILVGKENQRRFLFVIMLVVSSINFLVALKHLKMNQDSNTADAVALVLKVPDWSLFERVDWRVWVLPRSLKP